MFVIFYFPGIWRNSFQSYNMFLQLYFVNLANVLYIKRLAVLHKFQVTGGWQLWLFQVMYESGFDIFDG